METRAYFLFGDLVSNLVVGLLAATICGFLFSSWPMVLGMIIAMFLGMLISTVLTVTVLLKWFGAMEIMLPVMTTGMFAAMAVIMWPPEGGYTLIGASEIGLTTGFTIFVLTWIINSIMVGRAPAS